MAVYLILLLLFLTLLIIHIFTRHSRRGRLYNKIPGPTPYPIVGNLLMFINSSMVELWEVGHCVLKQYYPIVRIWGIGTALINVYHPDDLEILLTSQKAIEKGYVYDYFHPWLKDGLLTSTGEKWRNRRKILTSAFHFDILKRHINIISEQAEKMIEILEGESDETVIDLIPFCCNYTLNIICESTMGVSLDNMDVKKIDEYREAIHDMGKVICYRLLKPYIPNCIMPYIPKMGKIQTNALKILHGFTQEIIKERRKYHENIENKNLINKPSMNQQNYFDGSRKRRLAMLDLLLEAERSCLIDNEGIQEEIDTFTFEGHDTSGMAMTYNLMLLAENKEIQDRARAEVMEIFDEINGKVGMAEIQKLHYLERCIKEALRLFPPVATLMRFCEEELQLKHALIPSKSHYFIHFWETHRDPIFWPNPDEFDPDRFLPENIKNRHPFAYVPFSAGPRNCIGQKFAMMELKLLIAKILQKFYLEPIDLTKDIKIVGDIVLRPLNPVRIKFVRIHK